MSIIKTGGKCPKCQSNECDLFDTDYGMNKDNVEVLINAMVCNVCGCQFLDEYLYITTRIEE